MENQKYISLEDLKELMKETGYTYLGHGVGRAQNEMEVVESIFHEGLRTKDNSLYYTTIGLNRENLETTLNHWEHLDSKQIIFIRLPNEYINRLGESSDLDGERFGAFYQEKNLQNKVIYYVDPKFILGCYDVKKHLVLCNPMFEKDLKEDTIKNLEIKYTKCLEKTKMRLQKQEDILEFYMVNPKDTVDWGLDDFDDKNWTL